MTVVSDDYISDSLTAAFSMEREQQVNQHGTTRLARARGNGGHTAQQASDIGSGFPKPSSINIFVVD